ncbi:hypothetical protein IRJ34_07345 [Paenarthrobacter sp. GOM3]|uniref:hypothetical protein n=1 Tax=Paenarthrobacter sp. GOM3 TaxID=2782567 RepID=UPI001BA6C7D2|nr:hypothetical protein [Paenarthrobacter sp. GOM3]WOH20131.1 hypothetical protein IRJ34_07345 [Paenarthrobacter sp. GOM3]
MATPPILTLANGVLPTNPQFWLDAATAEVRRFCGWHVLPEHTEELVLDGNGLTELLIPSGNILDVTACSNDGIDVLSSLDWSAKGILALAGGRWTRKNRGVRITLRHGFDEAPDVAGVVAGVAARAAAQVGPVVRQNAGPMGVSYGTVNGAPISLPLLETEKETLLPYKLVWGV